MTDLKLKFEEPENGWVPVNLKYQREVIEFCGSDVPNNPIQDLSEALWKILRGESSTVWWHLEPGGYYFTFNKKNEDIEFKVLFEENSDKSKWAEVLTVTGSIKTIVLPMWRGLKEFMSYSASEPHWPEVHEAEIEKLGEAIKYEANNG